MAEPRKALKIWVLSDLLLEFAPIQLPGAEADVVVLAGDIDLGTAGVEWAIQTFRGRPGIYVAGNHEFYRVTVMNLCRPCLFQDQHICKGFRAPRNLCKYIHKPPPRLGVASRYIAIEQPIAFVGAQTLLQLSR